MRIRLSLVLPALLCTAAASAQSLSGPESVEFDAAGNRWLVSNRTAGQLLARSSAGTLSVFTDDPASPAGIEINGSRVFVADGGRVRAYRLNDAVRELDYAVTGASFLNGIASDGAGRLWVSDFSGQDIHQLDISNLAQVTHSTPLLDIGFQPNGLFWDAAGQRLLIVSWGSNARVRTWQPGDAQPTTLIQTSFSNFDGVALDCTGAVYVSSWGAQAILRAPAPLSTSSVLVSFAGSQSNPADIHFAAATGEIGVPNAGNSTLAFLPTACADQVLRNGFE
jgi:hypothetical protein